MFKYLPRVWLKERFIDDVPPEDAFCEFECETSECQLGDWVTCKRRFTYLELAKADDKSPTTLPLRTGRQLRCYQRADCAQPDGGKSAQ
jgi:hypothetical protein